MNAPARPALTPAETIAVLRRSYPAALICVACALLLATSAASYVNSNLTEAARLAYVCAECHLDAADAAQLRATRAEILAQNVASRRAGSAARTLVPAPVEEVQSAPSTSATSSTVLRYSPTSPTAVASGRAHRSGRPPVSATERKRKTRERVRAHRARRKAVAA